MKVKYVSFLILSISFKTILYSQYYSDKESLSLNYGAKVGVIRSVISNLETTILSEPYFLNYTLKAAPRYGWTGGMFLNYRFIPVAALETELMYSQQGSDLLFNNSEKDFNYRMQFAYQYVNVSGQIKLYPWGNKDNALVGIYVGTGPQLGLNIASQNIIYTSGGTGRLDAFGSDLEQQQQLRNVLKGKPNLGFNFGIGYEFANFGLTIDARYFLGVSDVLETQANSYNFIENKNTNNVLQFTIGWDFSFFNPKHQ